MCMSYFLLPKQLLLYQLKHGIYYGIWHQAFKSRSFKSWTFQSGVSMDQKNQVLCSSKHFGFVAGIIILLKESRAIREKCFHEGGLLVCINV